MSIQTQFFTIVPLTSGNEDGHYPNGSGNTPSWSPVPNLTESASFSVDVLTTYITPTTGCTCVLNGTLPAGWTFDGTTLSYDGTTVNSSPTTGLTFTATLTSSGATATSNAFSVQGTGSIAPDTTPPTIPLALAASAIGATTATITGLGVSDPAPSGQAWSGAGFINLIRSPGSSVQIAVAKGLQPVLTFADIGTVSPASTITQSGPDISFTTVNQDNPYPTVDGRAYAGQVVAASALTGVSGKIAAFASSAAYNNLRLEIRASRATNAAYVAVVVTPFANGVGVWLEYRSATGASAVALAKVANSGALNVFLQPNGNTFTGYISGDGNTLQSLGSVTQNMGTTLLAGAGANSNNGSQVSGTVQQLNISTIAPWSHTFTGLADNTTYTVDATSQDVDGNVSAAGNTISVTTGTTPTGDIDFNATHWAYSYNLDATGSSDESNEMDAIIASGAKVKGYVACFSLRFLQTNPGTGNSNVQGYFNIAGTIKATMALWQSKCAAAGFPGNHFAAMVFSREFSAGYPSTVNPHGEGIPDWVLNSSASGPGPPNAPAGCYGYYLGNQTANNSGVFYNLGLNLWQPQCMAAKIAAFVALATTATGNGSYNFNTDPTFEFIYDGDEFITSPSQSGQPSNYSNANLISQYVNNFYPQVAAAWPNTSKVCSLNWPSNGGQPSDLLTMMAAASANGWDFGCPDVYYVASANPNQQATGGTYGLYITAQQYFMGNVISGGAWVATGTKYYNGIMGCSVNIQQPDYTHPNPAGIWTACQTMKASRIMWGYIGPNDTTPSNTYWAQVVSIINANPALNNTCPSNYSPAVCITS